MNLSKTYNPAKNRMPAEWERQQAVWFSWPHNPDTWIDKLPAVEQVLAQAVRELATGETVRINVLDAEHEAHIRERIGAEENIVYHHFPTNDSWCRDHGAVFVVRDDSENPLAAINWGYNAWGGKYPPYDLDDALPPKMADALGVPCFETDMILEGGSIEVNGAGLLLTTEECLLNPNRNPDLSKADIEQRLRRMLGVKQIIWLGGDLAGDDTDGHIDNLTRFVSEDTVVTIVEDDPNDTNYDALQANLQLLQRVTLPDGRPLRIIPLPMPAPIYEHGVRMPASYANFLIANAVVLLPAYNDPNDAVAQATLQRCFPDRRVVTLDCRDVIWGLGAFHCLSQQVPAPGPHPYSPSQL
jgi:agmatine deiminase